MVRFVLLVLIIAIGVWGYNCINPQDFSQDKLQESFKKEKTINAVQKNREKRRLEAEKVMDQF